MLIKILVGVTFYEDGHFARKIQSFRARYDEKLHANPSIFMPIVPPFEVPVTALDGLESEISDDVESFFPENQSLNLGFTGVDVFTHHRKTLLYLNPVEMVDLQYCEETLRQVCKTYLQDREHGPKDSKKFLTIGRFTDPTSLHGAMTVAAREFEDCTSLPMKSICLFQKHNGVWMQQADLYRFPPEDQTFMATEKI